MPIESWLDSLVQADHSAIDGDLEVLAGRDYPFLTNANVSSQIERLSGHLGRRHQNVRRLVIGYSLYIRQVDVILQSGPRAFCGSACPRPPVGCCTREHFVIMNVADLMSSRNSPAALHMAHLIGLLQQAESAHNRTGHTMRPGYCSLLAEHGCTLRLFKSPRCAHFLCDGLEQDMLRKSGGAAQPLLSAMKHTEGSTISSPADYQNQTVIDEAVRLYPDSRSQARGRKKGPVPFGTGPKGQ
jgi:hypothetical protein